MRTKITDFIPTTAPHLLYEKDVPTAGPDDVFDPIIAGDLVLVSLDPYEFVSDRFIRAFAGQKPETEHQDSSERPVQHVGWALLRRKPETVLPSPGYQGEPYPDQKTILQAFDLRKGTERFSLTVPIQPAPRDVLPTLPGVTSAGTILQGLYQQDLFLHVYHKSMAALGARRGRSCRDPEQRLLSLGPVSAPLGTARSKEGGDCGGA